MLEDVHSASRGAILHQSPRKTNIDNTTPLGSPSGTPAASPERKRRDAALGRENQIWPRSKPTPTAINVASSQYGHSNRGNNFTVDYVSNGLIYLRPVIKSGSERHQNYVFPPSTPPSSAEEIEERRRGKGMGDASRNYNRISQESPPKTPTRIPAVERSKENTPYIKSSPPVPPKRRQRSRSYSTVDNHNFTTVSESTFGNVQVRIDQFDGGVREDVRPRTAGRHDYFHSLDVHIPNYNLGSPRFSPNGTPFLYGASSLNIPSTTGEMGSSAHTSQADMRWIWPGSDKNKSQTLLHREISKSILSTLSPGLQPSISTKMMSQSSAPSPLAPSATLTPIPLMPSPPVPIGCGPFNISPQIYDDLSFPPGSESPSIVRYDSRTHEISAATPARIIAQITSAAFVDYHLLSDFFLTYRLFMSPNDLASHLLARLKWAIDRGDDTGKVVRVRTFVAIRHWLLNYFADDFVPSRPFRKQFSKSLNELTNSVRASDHASDLKIIGELKRCWRRTCALYWDSPVSTELGVEEDITPGGAPGTRDEGSSSAHSVLRLPGLSPPPRLDSVRPDMSSGTESFIRDVVQSPDVVKVEITSEVSLPRRLPHATAAGDASPNNSSFSATALPPGRNGHRKKAVSSEGLTMSSSKKIRPSAPHKRSGSFSDALRDNRHPLPLPNCITKPTTFLKELPYATSLVRGNLFPPSQAFVEVIAPSTPVHEISGFKFGAHSNSSYKSMTRSPDRSNGQPKSLGGPGMKRIFGSMRKALGVKPSPQPSINEGIGSIHTPTARIAQKPARMQSDLSVLDSYTTNYTQLRMGVLGEGKVARIDLLGAGAVEAFQRAMLEAEAESEHLDGSFVVTSGEDYVSMGDSENLKSQVDMDGAMDARTDVAVELGSNASNISEDSNAGVTTWLEKGDDDKNTNFLDSPSTLGPRDPDGLVSEEMSFLVDKSERAVSGRNSVNDETTTRHIARSVSPASTIGYKSLGVRRSKSFSFERTPLRFNRAIGHAHPGSSDNRSLYSGKSLKRAASELSQFSTAMDNISEFSEFTEAFGNHEALDDTKGMLRRRPGGNLRQAAMIGELEPVRPKSAFSIESSAMVELQARPLQRSISPSNRASSKISDARPVGAGTVSLGAMGKGGAILSVHPEVPATPDLASDPSRLSDIEKDQKQYFEAGIHVMLRDLPDDSSDDGGVEVALAKLEGTYQRKKSGSSSPFDVRRSTTRLSNRDMDTSLLAIDEDDWRNTGFDGTNDPEEHHRRLKRRHKQVVDQIALQTPRNMDGSSSVGEGAGSQDLARGHSGDSVQFLERGVSVGAFKMGRNGAARISDDTVADDSKISEIIPATTHTSAMDLDRVDSELERHLEKRQTGDTLDDAASDLSSEISFEMIQKVASNGTSGSPGKIISELGIASHPLRHPPSPPLTMEQALSLSPGRTKSDYTPKTPRKHRHASHERIEITPKTQSFQMSQFATPRGSCQSDILQPTAVHLPFILAYDSELLAKQFTLIEKDALLEVDWKELVELSWRQTDGGIKDWVELLNSKDIRGVEVVIARFNLMCKWARSEVVMTRSADERARTIVKLIHIAAHARELYNYATMYQITIALLTVDVARLRKTWELVSPAEKETFRELETLVQPVRNFHNLRTEMDKVTGESGCIPFVGLFTHDLILNAQRPPYVHAADGKAKNSLLVNFERHRMTAAIVKRLLRLVEASHKYTFEAVDGVCERCLWVSALSDEEIKGLSKGIE